MTIGIEAWRRDRFELEMIKVTEAVFTFVAVDNSGRPRQVVRPQDVQE